MPKGSSISIYCLQLNHTLINCYSFKITNAANTPHNHVIMLVELMEPHECQWEDSEKRLAIVHIRQFLIRTGDNLKRPHRNQWSFPIRKTSTSIVITHVRNKTCRCSAGSYQLHCSSSMWAWRCSRATISMSKDLSKASTACAVLQDSHQRGFSKDPLSYIDIKWPWISLNYERNTPWFIEKTWEELSWGFQLVLIGTSLPLDHEGRPQNRCV